MFKELRAYLPQDSKVRTKVLKQEQALLRLTARCKIEKWRDEVIAHRTFAVDCRQFFEDNKCTLDEAEKFVSIYQRMLHSFSFALFDLGFRIRDHGPRAHRGVNRLIASMKEGRSSASTARAILSIPDTGISIPEGRQATFREEFRCFDRASATTAIPRRQEEDFIRQKLQETYGGSAKIDITRLTQ